MEDDTDDKHKMSQMDPYDATKSIADTMFKATKSIAVPPSTMALSLPSSQSSLCSTPLLDEVESDILKQQHTLHTYDSGFSDWTPDSAPSLSSLCETPSMIAQSTASIVSESGSTESFQRHQRRSWPMRTRKLSFQSPDVDTNTTPASPSSHISLHSAEEGECGNTDNSNSARFHLEEEVRLILSQSSIAKQSPISQFLERSRSFSRSPLSSVSDDLESSLQEMSLEESSSSNSSSNQPSPTLCKSSSPVFSFSLQYKTESNMSAKVTDNDGRKLSQLLIGNGPSVVQDSNCVDRITNNTSLTDRNELQLKDNTSLTSNGPFSQRDEKHADVVDFASSLSLVPVVDIPRSSSTTFHEPVISTLHPEHIPSLHVPTSTWHQCHCLNPRVCSTCQDDYPSTSVYSSFIKSPIKRISDAPPHNLSESVSPQKMRRLRLRGKSAFDSGNLKRDLFTEQGHTKPEMLDSKNSFEVQPCAIYRSADERTPQFLHMESSPSSTKVGKSQRSSISKNHVTPVSRWRGLKQKNSDNYSDVKFEERSTEKDVELIDRILLKFSPPIPSQLIGRHVGVKKFDILGELHQHNIFECVELVLSFIPDSDLPKIAQVSAEWKCVLFAEPKAYKRYKVLCKKAGSPRKVRNHAEKENVPGKPHEKESVPMTSSKGHLTTIQPQFVTATDPCTPSIPQKPDLLCEDCTRNCPHCQCRAMVVPSQDRAICMSDKCAYDFCTKCFFPFHHPNPCKPLFHSSSKTMLAGSKKSKKNLKRLKNP